MSKKWKRLWLGLAVLVAIQVVLLWSLDPNKSRSESENENSNAEITALAIDVVSTLSGIYLSLLIFIRTSENGAKEHVEAMKHMKELHTAQIDVLIAGTDRQISLWQQITARQTRELVEAIRNQNLTTHKNDDAVVKAIKVNYELSKIDYDIEKCEYELNEAKEEMKKIKEFHFLRSQEERVREIKLQQQKINNTAQRIADLKYRRKSLVG